MRVIVLGGDGFLGWPLSLHLSALGHSVSIFDSLVRRSIDRELGTNSLLPIASLQKRCQTWNKISDSKIHFNRISTLNFSKLKKAFELIRPDVVIHLAEQRSAPYSMISLHHKESTLVNNLRSTLNVVEALSEMRASKTKLIHLGSMGVYGYVGQKKIRETYGERFHNPIDPGSIYHLSKVVDELLLRFYYKYEKIIFADLHQGIIWGTQTEQTRLHPDLSNRFDYDGVYGTVCNRFLVEKVLGHKPSVYGDSRKKRAFIHLSDSIKCIEKFLSKDWSEPQVIHQFTEILSLEELKNSIFGKSQKSAVFPNFRMEKTNKKYQAENYTIKRILKSPKLINRHGLAEEALVAENSHNINEKSIIMPIYWKNEK